ncbi:MAG: hypothetical protein QN162_14630 [Armatimonadota bacterium]|nr:hypothetical protein [Armatimonadota bacterium]
MSLQPPIPGTQNPFVPPPAAAAPQAVPPPIIESESFAPPLQGPYALTLSDAERERLGSYYGDELLRALEERRTGAARSFQWEGDATTARRFEATGGETLGRTKGFEADLQEWWARYEGLPPVRELPFEGAANFRVPLSKWAVDAIHARLVAGLTTVRPYSRVEPLEPEETQAAADLEEFLDWCKEHELGFELFLDDYLLNAAVEGTAVAYLTWERRERHRLAQETVDQFDETGEFDQITGQPILKRTRVPVLVDQPDVVEEGPRLDLIPLVDFLVADWRRKRLDEQPWVAHRTRLYAHELRALREQDGYFADAIDELLQGGGSQYTEGTKPPHVASLEERTGIAEQLSPRADRRWWEIWVITAWYDSDADGKPERVIFEVAMPQRRLIRALKFPYIHGQPPYILCSLIPRPNHVLGRSLVGDLRMVQDEIDAIHNMRTDAVTVAIGSLFTFIHDEMVDPGLDRRRISLGEPMRVEGDINHLQILAKSFRGVNPPGMDIEQMLLGFAERISGISDPQAGRPTEGRKTAFEIGAVIQEGNVRFRQMIRRVAAALAELDYQLVGLYQQYSARVGERIMRVLRRNTDIFQGVDSGRFRFRIHGAAIASNQDIDAKRALELLQLAEQSGIIQFFVKQDPRRMYHLAKTVLDKAGRGDVPTEAIIGSEAELMAFMQRMAMMQQMQVAVGSPPGGPPPPVGGPQPPAGPPSGPPRPPAPGEVAGEVPGT